MQTHSSLTIGKKVKISLPSSYFSDKFTRYGFYCAEQQLNNVTGVLTEVIHTSRGHTPKTLVRIKYSPGSIQSILVDIEHVALAS